MTDSGWTQADVVAFAHHTYIEMKFSFPSAGPFAPPSWVLEQWEIDGFMEAVRQGWFAPRPAIRDKAEVWDVLMAGRAYETETGDLPHDPFVWGVGGGEHYEIDKHEYVTQAAVGARLMAVFDEGPVRIEDFTAAPGWAFTGSRLDAVVYDRSKDDPARKPTIGVEVKTEERELRRMVKGMLVCGRDGDDLSPHAPSGSVKVQRNHHNKCKGLITLGLPELFWAVSPTWEQWYEVKKGEGRFVMEPIAEGPVPPVGPR